MREKETMSEYLDKFRTTAGELEAIGAPLE